MGGIIRSEKFASEPAFSFADVERQAREMIARAKAHAQRIVDESEGHIREVTEAHKREGYQAGLDEGRRTGYETARHEAREQAVKNAEAELRMLTDALRAGLAEFERQKRTLLARAEAGLIELAMAIGRRVCKLQAERTGEAALTNARALLEMVKHHADLELRVNPAEYDLLSVEAHAIVESIAGLEHVAITSDPRVERGGCILRTRDGTIDATITTQLDRVAEAICAAAPDRPRRGDLARKPADEAGTQS